jgi:indole-3-glycerol phosphate synthase/phosphoribosylanthranilate isomerase/anthranilate synthase/indole-3-glycerol phosphate synthase/phosphoribosylanthranilate isomerase
MFLDQIVTRTLGGLEQTKKDLPLEEIQRQAAQMPPARDLFEALYKEKTIQLIAEIKRASPSKGILAADLDPVATARLYEANGAAAISVLTEPHFFLGSGAYLQAVKQNVSLPVLRKDFILDEYQVYQARAWGADAILLICAILDDRQLRQLLELAHRLGMRCLVEVHSRAEAERAVAAGAMIIGVNSRDLTTFKMNPDLIRELRQELPHDRVIVAESGIHTAADARRLARYDVQAMLVGESLVVSSDIATKIQGLLQGANAGTQVKICGLNSLEQLQTATEAGADLLGLMQYEPSFRYIRPEKAHELVQQFKEAYGEQQVQLPDLVGIFVDEEPGRVNELADELGLHFVQLHGKETPEYCRRMNRPVIKALHLREETDLEKLQAYRESSWRIMIDTPPVVGDTLPGGLGRTSNWQLARQAASTQRIFLAGGLNPENVAEGVREVHPWGVDVSSGVETNRQKDLEKIRRFIAEVRNAFMSEKETI